MHQSFAEFLAANWLSGLDFERVASLICLPDDPERRIAPQLQGTVAWLAVMHPQVFAHVLAIQANLLVGSTLARVPFELRPAVVDALLALVARERVDPHDSTIRGALAGLAHPRLPEQLIVVLSDQDQPLQLRTLACEIASACKLQALGESLVDLALDSAAPIRLRTEAAMAIDQIDVDDVQRARLLGLTSAELDDDDADELKGAALLATWPRVMDGDQLFAAITPPREPGTLGLYSMFMSTQLLDGLEDADIPIALRWAASHYDPYSLGRLELLALQVVVRAWSHLDDAEVIELIAGIAQAQLATHAILLQPSGVDTAGLFVDESGRRQLILRLIDAVADDAIDPGDLVHSAPPLLDRKDLPWVIEQLVGGVGETNELAWARLANQLWTYDDDEAVELIWEALDSSQELAQVAADRIAPIPLDSEIAERNRVWYQRNERVRRQRAEQEAEQKAWRDGLAERLIDAAAAPRTTWPELSSILTGERRNSLLREAEERTVDSPGFELADSSTRQVLVDLAEHFLTDTDPRADDWLATGEIPAQAISAVRALDLMLAEAPTRLDSLDPDAWSRWIPALATHTGGHDAKGEAVRELRERANAIHPDQVAHVLIRLIAAEDRRTGRAWQLAHADEIRSPELETRLTSFLEAGGLRPDSVGDVVAYGLRANYASIRRWALEMVDSAQALSWMQLEYVSTIRIAAELMQRAPDAGWLSVWPAMQASAMWGIELAQAVAEIDRPRLDQALDEDELAELFTWLHEHFPAEQDPQPITTVTRRTRVAWWRDSMLNALAVKGTHEAVQALGTLREMFPSLSGLSSILIQADDERRRSAWRPPNPASVIALGLDVDRRLVSGDLDLLRVVQEALVRVQQRLRPPNPAAADLWDTAVGKPKSEEDISDWLQRQLQDEFDRRLIVVDREVQVSRLPGGGVGERTDLLVRAAAGNDLTDAEMVSLVIEVKGCWNQRLAQDMADQLADRYLAPPNQRCGIYLIAWFDAAHWTADDYRKSRCVVPKDSLEQIYRNQAADLSDARDLVLQSVVLDGSLPNTRRSRAAVTSVDGPHA